MTTSRSQAGGHLRLVAGPPPTEADDPALVRALLDDEKRPEAAREMVRRYGPMVQRILRRSLGRGADIQDVTQEVFLRVFNRVATIQDPQALKQFVISVTVNVLKWQLKRNEVRRWVGLGPRENEIEGLADEPDPDAREALRRFDGILRRLSVHDRTLFVLRYMEELTLPEVARATSVSLATVKRHLDGVWRRVTDEVAADPFLAGYLPRPNHRSEGVHGGHDHE